MYRLHARAGLLHLPLTTLHAGSAGLTDALPDWVATMRAASTLTSLQLQSNGLAGPMPPSWNGTNLPLLSCLRLSGNAGLCGAVADDLPCFDVQNTQLGAHTAVWYLCSHHILLL
jgi:hypothetical protein